jgi:hypothetical protein
LTIACGIAACSSSPTATVDEIEQEFLFEVEYVNFAWGVTWKGFYIDRLGEIVVYDRGDLPWAPEVERSIREDELVKKYALGRRSVGQVSPASLVEGFALIRKVKEEFSQSDIVCYDAGGLGFTAFAYDAPSARYVPLTLREEGTHPRQNTSAAARELTRWLTALVRELEIPGVSLFGDQCAPGD